MVSVDPEQERQWARPAHRNGGSGWPAVIGSVLVIVVSWLRGTTTVERGCREASDKRMSGFSAERPIRRNYSAERLIGRIAGVFEIVPALLLGGEGADVTDGSPEGVDYPGADALR